MPSLSAARAGQLLEEEGLNDLGMRDVVELLRDYSSRSVKVDKTGAVTHRGDHEEELAVPPIELLRSVLDELAPSPCSGNALCRWGERRDPSVEDATARTGAASGVRVDVHVSMQCLVTRTYGRGT